MTKICPQCKTEMMQIGDETILIKGCIIISKGDGFRYNNTYGDLTAYHYVCSKCGLVQQYVPETLREHLENIDKN